MKYHLLIVFFLTTQLLCFDMLRPHSDQHPPLYSDCTTDCCRTLSDRPPMTYVYYQKTGRFVGGSGESRIDTYGYSGYGVFINDPEQECN